MQIRVERDALAHAVTWAARTLPSRPSMPVLSGDVGRRRRQSHLK